VGWTIVYLGATVLMTWPLAANITSHLPNSAVAAPLDLLHIGWALAHQSRALVEGISSYADAGIYYPTANSLFYGQTGIGALPVFAPIYLITKNPTLALNVLLFFGCTATALSLHLVLRRVTASDAAGFVAAWTFLMCRWMFWTFVPSVPNYSLLAFFPLLILLVAQPLGSFRAALWILPLIVAQCLPDIAYLAFSLLAALGVVAVAQLPIRSRRADGWRLLGVLVITVLILSPFYVMYGYISSINPDIATQTRWIGLGQMITTFPWGFRMYVYPTSIPILATPLIILGCCMTLWRWRREGSSLQTSVWAVSLLFVFVGLWISLTPRISWFGSVIEMPHQWVSEITPLYGRFRVPARLAISALMGLCMLAGLATAEIIQLTGTRLNAQPRRILAASLALVVGVLWSAQAGYGVGEPLGQLRRQQMFKYPLRLAPGADSQLVQALVAGTGTVLELPSNPRKPARDAAAMYRAIFHQRPLINGYNGYWPKGYSQRIKLASRLPDPQIVAQFAAEAGLRHVVVHMRALPPAERLRWQKLKNTPNAVLLREGQAPNGDWLLFRVQPSTGGETTAKILPFGS
jgi:hypothetical protein